MSAIGDKPNQLVVHGMLGSAAYFDVKDLPTSSATQTQIDAAISNLATVASTGKYTDLTDIPTTFAPAAHSHPISDVTGLQTALDSKAATTTTISAGTGMTGGGTLAANRSLALNAASIASLAKADTALQPVTGQGLYPDADKTKLAGVATGATKNATDAQLRARSSHTGTQAISTVDGLQAALDSKVESVASHGLYPDVDKTKLADIATGATANATDAQLRARSSHTGTQAASTITGLSAVATAGTYASLTDAPAAATTAALRTGTLTTPSILAPKTFYDAAAFVALTSAATITPNLNTGNNFTLTLTHNATLANPTGAKSGQSGTFYVSHTGTNTLSFGAAWKFIGGAQDLPSTAGQVVITYQVVDTSTIISSFGVIR